jgi:hypothetical protein
VRAAFEQGFDVTVAAPAVLCCASFHAGDYDRYPEPLGRIRSLGFPWVTLIPTFAVREPFEFVPDYTPRTATIRAVLFHALALGFDVKLEPHIDWTSTLDASGPWRGHMQFDPADAYFDRVIAPMRELAVEACGIYPDRRIALTLGSEVDRSLRESPDAWMRLLEQSRVEGVEIGHKVNHDADRGLLRAGYLAKLDWVSFSFYPTLRFQESAAWWRTPHSDEEFGGVAARFRRRATKLKRELPPGPKFQIGEFGLGSADVEHPYRLDPQFFREPDAGDRLLRCNFYAGFLHALRSGIDAGLVTFWTAGSFDFLGVFDSRYKDEELIRLTEEYNR